LQQLALAIAKSHSDWLGLICDRLQQLVEHDAELAVQARAQWAIEQLQPQLQPLEENLSRQDWQEVLGTLYVQKSVERRTIAAGDPRNFQALAAALTTNH
jgi:hypothetical protein